jgi:predicted flap endonuclease-1-like 5' DNA nuclease
MRLDCFLYTIAIIFFVITGMSFILVPDAQKNLWIVATTVLGLFFVVIGYTQRPKRQAITTEAPPLQPPTPPAPQLTPKTTEESLEAVAAPPKIKIELTKVKGIGEKRAAQLKSLGISGVEDLVKASAEDLAAKLKVSSKITARWIENAKVLLEGSEKI